MTGQNWVGRPMPRREDRRFLTGAGRFTDDIALDGQAHAMVLRAPHAHARIAGIDAAAARAAPGVLLVLTADDIAGELTGPIPSYTDTPPFDVGRRGDGPPADGSQFPLATDRVRYLGEAVAFVVAETAAAAQDTIALVEVDYAPLPAVMTLEQALAADAPGLWDDAPDNVSFEWQGGDAAATADAFADAAHVTRLELVNNRVVINFMEPRACIADVDAASGRLTLHAGCQGGHGLQMGLASLLGIEADGLHVIVPDTGGGFGARGSVYPEFVLTLLAARRLGRPVKWTAERSEAFLSDTQARDHVMRGELALDADGHFLGLRAAIDWRHGAYLPGRSTWVIAAYLPPTLGGAYRVPCGDFSIRGVFTNTTPLAAYRGIGRVEANYLIESLIDAAARETGRDPVELRRANLVSEAELPWITAGGNRLTSGEFAANMARALELADWTGFEDRRQRSAGEGRLRGIGLGLYVENDGGVPTDYAEVTAATDGTVTACVGTQDFGMGHETMYAQVLADELGIAPDKIEVVFGDTDRVARGGGAHGSRTARIGGGAAVKGAQAMLDKGRTLAADMLEADAGDIEFTDGRFRIAGTDRGAGLAEVAAFAEARDERLSAEADFLTEAEAHTNGAHVCEVSIDPADGTVRVENHIIVADVGRAINPLIVHGQMHGGAAQGIGQALLEQVVYDADSGQTLSGSFMDYTLPRADDLPLLTVDLNEVPEADNPLGVKGAGENATSGAPAALMNAVRAALATAGVQHFDMPATPERVWRALREAAGD